jgi:hypothetical protein
MDPLWRGKESVVKGKHVLVIFSVSLTTREYYRKLGAMEN